MGGVNAALEGAAAMGATRRRTAGAASLTTAWKSAPRSASFSATPSALHTAGPAGPDQPNE